mmetsp:Transcript_49745/g.131839  ORF Transcript_49745/g.131839 Transcript_49745/m.131839 type:complete len:100 (-) Transcript_49745:29-328(-)
MSTQIQKNISSAAHLNQSQNTDWNGIESRGTPPEVWYAFDFNSQLTSRVNTVHRKTGHTVSMGAHSPAPSELRHVTNYRSTCGEKCRLRSRKTYLRLHT